MKIITRYSNKIIHILLACLIILASCQLSMAGHSIVKDAKSGEFDYYVFAQAWYPIFCEGGPKGECEKISDYMKNNMSPHGLWPNLNGTDNKASYSMSCIKSPGCITKNACNLDIENINQDTLSQIRELMPSGLLNHEWHKHGTCTGLTQEEYLKATLEAQKLYKTPEVIKDNIGDHTDYNSITAAFGGEQMVNTFCKTKNKKQYLDQIHHFLDKNLRPIKKKYHSTNCKKDAAIYVR